MPSCRGLSPCNSQHRYYNTHSVCGIENEQSTIMKKADSVASLHSFNQCATAPNSVSVLEPNNDLLKFIEKQERYIEQLERESQFCRVSHLSIFIRMTQIHILVIFHQS